MQLDGIQCNLEHIPPCMQLTQQTNGCNNDENAVSAASKCDLEKKLKSPLLPCPQLPQLHYTAYISAHYGVYVSPQNAILYLGVKGITLQLVLAKLSKWYKLYKKKEEVPFFVSSLVTWLSRSVNTSTRHPSSCHHAPEHALTLDMPLRLGFLQCWHRLCDIWRGQENTKSENSCFFCVMQ